MSEDLEALQATLKRIASSKDQESATRTKALTVAMQGVQAALAELLANSEKKSDDDEAEAKAMDVAVNRIVMAIEGFRIEAPDVSVQPTFNVAAPEVKVEPNITVQPSEVNLAPVFNVPAAEVCVALDKGTTTIRFKFEHQGPKIVGGTATITRG